MCPTKMRASTAKQQRDGETPQARGGEGDSQEAERSEQDFTHVYTKNHVHLMEECTDAKMQMGGAIHTEANYK